MGGSAFDLDVFAPVPVSFTVTENEVKKTYQLNGDPDVDVVARMLRIEDAIGESSKQGDVNEIVAHVQEGKQLIVELILSADASQDVSLLDLNTQGVMTLFALVMHGGSVAAAVAEAISRPTLEGAEGDDPVTTGENGLDADGADADASPLVSARSSSARSSISDESDDGAPVTGTA